MKKTFVLCGISVAICNMVLIVLSAKTYPGSHQIQTKSPNAKYLEVGANRRPTITILITILKFSSFCFCVK